MEGCSQVYHMAAFADVWARDPKVFYDINTGGTETVLKAALRHGVERLVFTSTAGTLGPSEAAPNVESKIYKGPHLTHYDRSKSLAEDLVMDYASTSLDAVVVNPTRIYGPGPLVKSNTVTLMIDSYTKGKWRLIPGNGQSVGNYVFVGDLVDGHLLAMEKGKRGERYIISGDNLSFNELFKQIAEVSGVEQKMWKIPIPAMLAYSGSLQSAAWIRSRFTRSHRSPPIIPAFVRRYQHNWLVSNEKARSELGYAPVGFREGLRRTLEWLGFNIP